MVYQRFAILTRTLAAVVVSLGSTLTCAGHGGGGHGGGGGHALGGYGGYGCGFRGGLGYRGFYGYPGWYGFPGLYGFGLGLGLGYGLGYGYGGYGYGGYGYGGYGYGGYGYGGYGYGYPYYPYPAGYPVYVSPGYGPPPPAAPTAYPVARQGPAPAAPANPVPGAPIRLTDADVLLSIRVPPDAIVRINGDKTSQNGPRREFFSSGLLPGRSYTFVVAAQWTGPNGQAMEREQRVHVQGGERRNVDFLTTSPPAQDLR